MENYKIKITKKNFFKLLYAAQGPRAVDRLVESLTRRMHSAGTSRSERRDRERCRHIYNMYIGNAVARKRQLEEEVRWTA